MIKKKINNIMPTLIFLLSVRMDIAPLAKKEKSSPPKRQCYQETIMLKLNFALKKQKSI